MVSSKLFHIELITHLGSAVIRSPSFHRFLLLPLHVFNVLKRNGHIHGERTTEFNCLKYTLDAFILLMWLLENDLLRSYWYSSSFRKCLEIALFATNLRVIVLYHLFNGKYKCVTSQTMWNGNNLSYFSWWFRTALFRSGRHPIVNGYRLWTPFITHLLRWSMQCYWNCQNKQLDKKKATWFFPSNHDTHSLKKGKT